MRVTAGRKRVLLIGLISCLCVCVSPLAFAQQSFSFVVTAPDRDSTQPRTESTTMFTGNHLDPLVGAMTTNGKLTVMAMEDSRFDRHDARAVRQTEFLVILDAHPSALTVAIGGGVRAEGPDVNVLLTRVVAEKPSLGGRLTGNVLFERAIARDRDGLDLITTVGWTRRVTPILNVGVETLAEDLEGLWEANEADGGARLFVGPSIDVGSLSHQWTMHVTAGAGIQASSTTRSSDGLRAFGRSGFVMRISTSRHF